MSRRLKRRERSVARGSLAITHVELVGEHLRRTFPADGNGKAAAQAAFVALEQPGSLVRVTISETDHIDAVDRIVAVLDDLHALNWDKYKAQFDANVDDERKSITLELNNGSGIEIAFTKEVKVSKPVQPRR